HPGIVRSTGLGATIQFSVGCQDQVIGHPPVHLIELVYHHQTVPMGIGAVDEPVLALPWQRVADVGHAPDAALCEKPQWQQEQEENEGSVRDHFSVSTTGVR